MLYCKFCNKECKSNNSLKQHEVRCSKNPNKITMTPWNKGLTSDTDLRVKANTEHSTVALHNKYCKPDFVPYRCETCGTLVTEKFGSGRFCSRSCANSRPHSQEAKEKIGESVSLTINALNTYRKETAIAEYKKSPKYCAICGNELPYEKRNANTCSQQCTNKHLSITLKHVKETIEQHVEGRHIVYKVLSLLDGRYYIGVRKTEKEFDGYLGSGIIIGRLVKKYGKQNFKRETLFEFDNSTEAFNKEKEILSECLKDPLCVNIAHGGQGGCTFQGKHHSDETRKLLSEKAHEYNRYRRLEK